MSGCASIHQSSFNQSLSTIQLPTTQSSFNQSLPTIQLPTIQSSYNHPPLNHHAIIIQSPTITTFTCKNTPTHTRQTQQRHNRRQQRSPTGISNCTRTCLRIRNDGSNTHFNKSHIAATCARKRARFGDRPIAVLQRGGALQERQDDRGDSGRELRAGEAAD